MNGYNPVGLDRYGLPFHFARLDRIRAARRVRIKRAIRRRCADLFAMLEKAA